MSSKSESKALAAGAIFRKGSKSFSLAALLFDRSMYQAACLVYAWCRYCDDVVDDAEKQDQDHLLRAVDELRKKTKSIFHGDIQKDPIFAGFQEVAQKYGIQEQHALDLIEGMAMDARKERYWSFAELEVYAYRVAGTVGLMMSSVMGVRDPQAFPHAKNMGIAMQLTNISRDIIEDARLGRVYLPLHWLQEENITPEQLLDPSCRESVARLARRLVLTAEKYYADGEEGLKYLPTRAALAIASAARIYRAIGLLVLKRGASAWTNRTVVPLSTKLREMTIAIFRVWRFI